jgi:hypothetical protein
MPALRMRTAAPSARRRGALMLSCAVAALAVAVPARPAKAQQAGGAFQGSISSTVGSVTRNITGSTTETITIGSGTATINWSPYDTQGTGSIAFLPPGHTATFTNNPQLTSDFTVLNRIIPTDPSRSVVLSGSVISQLQTQAQGTTAGGKVWFYSPGGLIIGATAVFDVGGLLLTANDPINWSAGSGFTGRFQSSTSSNALVGINAGATITATPENSYVAIVAPRVDQGGTINVNGSAALVAAQDATLTINQGLFDINVTTGTGAANGIIHTGTTGGPASTAAGDRHGIYMVAVPKNQAMVAFLRGNVGFAPATSASVENGVIVLSAGYNVDGDAIGTGNEKMNLFRGSGGADGMDPIGGNLSEFHIDTGTYTSDVFARAANNVFSSGLAGDTTYTGDVTLIARNNAHINARNGNDITIGGTATVSTGTSDLYADRAPTVGLALLNAETGSTLSIAGNAIVDAGVRGDQNGSATGGTATVTSSGTLTIGGSLQVLANGYGGATSAGQAGSFGQGGSALVGAFGGGTLSTGGSLTMQADALAGVNQAAGTEGNSSDGGSVSLFADNGSVTVGGSATLNATAFGGTNFAGGTSGTGSGGSANVSTTGTGSIGVQTSLSLNVNGSGGGSGGTQTNGGGEGYGGDASVVANGGVIQARDISINARGTGSAPGASNSGLSGGDAYGGDVFLYASGGGQLRTTTGGITADVRATGGNMTGGALQGGEAFGGSIYVSTESATISVGNNLSLFAGATGGSVSDSGNGGAQLGGSAYGGDANIDTGTGTITVAGGTTLSADAVGGSGQTGGDAFGGSAGVSGYGGTANLGTAVNITALGTGGNANRGFGGSGGSGLGGTAYIVALADPGSVETDPSAATIIGGTATLNSSGFGGSGGAGNGSNIAAGAGGAGIGGAFGGERGTSGALAGARAEGAVLTLGNTVLTSNGTGGSGGAGGTGQAGGAGGTGQGGTAQAGNYVLEEAEDLTGTASYANLTLNARGTGGAGGSGPAGQGAGGEGFGGGQNEYGGALVNATGTVSANDIYVDVRGFGGSGSSGGAGFGGSAAIESFAGGAFEVGDITLTAAGHGGAGTQAGGAGSGGWALATVHGGSSLDSDGFLYLDAGGVGGTGGVTGGSASGGESTLTVMSGGTLTLDEYLSVWTNAYGLTGGSGSNGIGGDADAGSSTFQLAGSATILGETGLFADAFAGDGGTGGSASGGLAHLMNESGVLTAGSVNLSAFANAARGLAGAAGSASGGVAEAEALGTADFNVAGQFRVAAEANGQSGTTAGGSASGGIASLLVDGTSTVDAGSVRVTSSAFGGASHASGGSASGGIATVEMTGGTLSVVGGTTILANASGGSGTSTGNGGSASGGIASLLFDGGTAITNALFVQSTGIGGNGSIGGAGDGGIASVSIDSGGGWLTVPGSAQIFANGYGGTGTAVAGGAGDGGLASLEVSSEMAAGAAASLSFGSAVIDAGAFGGAGQTGSGAAGGEAFGGSASLDLGSGGLNVGTLQLAAGGFGGNGGSSASGAGGAGGSGSGGSTYLSVSGNMVAGNYIGWSFASGGQGGSGNSAGAGAGGAASGGSAFVEVLSDGTYAGTSQMLISASASGGNGGSGGEADGGSASLNIYGAFSTQSLSAQASATGGTGSSGAGGSAFGGSSDVEVSTGVNASLGAAALFAGGTGGAGTSAGGSANGGNASLIVGGPTGAASLSLAAGAIGGAASAGASGEARGGVADLEVSGTTLTVAGPTSLNVNASGGNGTTAAGDAYGGFAGLYGFDSTLSLQSLAFAANGAGGTGSNPGLSVGGDIAVDLFDSDLQATLLLANVLGTGGSALFDLSGSSIALSNLTVNAGGQVEFRNEGGSASLAAGTIIIDAGGFSSAFTLGADVLDLTVAGDFSASGLSAGQSLSVSAGGDLSAGALTAPGQISLSSGGNLSLSQPLSSGALFLSAGGSVSAGDLSGATVDVIAGGSLQVGDVSASQYANFDAGSIAGFFGIVAAPQITVSSADIFIDAGASLGVAGLTELVTLNARSFGQPIIIGGDPDEPTGQALQYRLAEEGEIVAEEIRIRAPSVAEGFIPDVVIDDVELSGSLVEGGVKTVSVSTGGSVIVRGEVLYGDAAAGDSLTITAGNQIRVDTSQGGFIALYNGAEGAERPSGSLVLAAQDIWVGSSNLLASLTQDQNFSGRNQALLTNPGSTDPVGHLVAGSMTLSVQDSLFVQNSGAANDFAGITVGAGGLAIRNGGSVGSEGQGFSASATSAPITVTAFGRRLNQDGSTTSGAQFFQTVDFGTGSGVAYASGSTFNNLAIGQVVEPPPPPPEEEKPQTPPLGGPGNILGPIQVSMPLITVSPDLFGGGTIGWTDETDGEGDAESNGRSGVPLNNALVNTGGAKLRQSLDDAVTSGGDSSLWLDDIDDTNPTAGE